MARHKWIILKTVLLDLILVIRSLLVDVMKLVSVLFAGGKVEFDVCVDVHPTIAPIVGLHYLFEELVLDIRHKIIRVRVLLRRILDLELVSKRDEALYAVLQPIVHETFELLLHDLLSRPDICLILRVLFGSLLLQVQYGCLQLLADVNHVFDHRGVVLLLFSCLNYHELLDHIFDNLGHPFLHDEVIDLRVYLVDPIRELLNISVIMEEAHVVAECLEG